VNIWYCGWTKRKFENLLKCNLEKKAQSNGKNRKSFKTAKLKKKITHLQTRPQQNQFVANFRTVPTKKLEIWRFSFFLGKIREKSPQIEEKITRNKEILKGFRVLTTKLGPKKTLVQTP